MHAWVHCCRVDELLIEMIHFMLEIFKYLLVNTETLNIVV